jgi:Zinc-binding dehydrogenase/Alcohol dehydrogenase GroES-like domain
MHSVPVMKAIARDAYGSPELLELREIEKPAAGADGVLVRVHASSVNAQDWHLLRGLPYFVRLIEGLSTPKSKVLGGDVAGIVEAVGEKVTEFQPGDEVFGSRYGAFADYVRGRERNFAPKPAGLTFEEAAAIPLAGITALQALRDRGGIQAGQRVLINGAAGGVGTFSVQIAKVFGAAVTAVCSTRNVDLVQSLGADEVIDYTAEDFTRSGREHELIFDIAGNRPLRDVRRAPTRFGISNRARTRQDGHLGVASPDRHCRRHRSPRSDRGRGGDALDGAWGAAAPELEPLLRQHCPGQHADDPERDPPPLRRVDDLVRLVEGRALPRDSDREYRDRIVPGDPLQTRSRPARRARRAGGGRSARRAGPARSRRRCGAGGSRASGGRRPGGRRRDGGHDGRDRRGRSQPHGGVRTGGPRLRRAPVVRLVRGRGRGALRGDCSRPEQPRGAFDCDRAGVPASPTGSCCGCSRSRSRSRSGLSSPLSRASIRQALAWKC